ncbi:MAG: prolipoprotein diacylglyceryl transferase [Nitriliruptoraceae bacterium]
MAASLVIAAIPPPPFQSLINVGPFDLRMYGFLIAVGALLAIRMTVRRFELLGGAPDLAEKAMMLALLFGFLGGRIGYIIPRFLVDGAHGAAYITRPGDVLAIWQGGLAFFGGLTGGAIAVYLYIRIKRADFPAIADAVAPALPLAQAIGRWGNYFNQELFGRPTDVAWALRVDPVPASTAARFPGATTFHPTFLYESLWNGLLVVVLLTVDRKGWLRRRGSLLWCYLIGYGIGRGWIEALRVDTVERYLGLSRNNWIAIAVVLAGTAGLVWWERGARRLTADETASDEDSTGADPLQSAGAPSAGPDTDGPEDTDEARVDHADTTTGHASGKRVGTADDDGDTPSTADDDGDAPGTAGHDPQRP